MRSLTARGHRGLRALMLGLAVVVAATAGTTISTLPASSASTPSVELQVSRSADRLGAQPLDNSALAGQVYVFLAAPTRSDIRRVEFFLNDPTMQRKPMRVERSWPWDLAGTSETGTAKPWNASSLADGADTLTARTTAAGAVKTVYRATFIVGTAATPSTTTSTTLAPTTTAPPTTAAPTTTTTAAPTTTTTPPPPTSGGCPAYPAVPDASCTGWQHTGVTLSPYTGPMTITQNGTVIDGKTITGTLTINANNVTVKRSQIRGVVFAGWEEAQNLLLEDCEIDGTGGNNVKGVQGGGFTINRCNIHHVAQGVDMGGGNITIRDSYIHDLYATGGFHSEPVLSNGGGPYTLIHNNLNANFDGGSGAMSAALGMYGDNAQIHDVTLQNNRFAASTGAVCAYGGSTPGKPFPTAANVKFLNNTFARLQSNCGSYVPVYHYASGNGNQFTGNVWEGTGAPVNP